MKRLAAAASLILASACGLADGLKGNPGEPAGGAQLAALSWHGPVQIDRDVAAEGQAPWLAWGQGAAWVSFFAYDPPTNTASAWVTRRPRGGSFARPVQVPTPSGWGGAAYPQIAIGESGSAVLGFTGWILDSSSIVTSSSIWVARVDPSLTVLQADLVQLATSNGSSASVQLSQSNSVAADEAGNALVLYSQNGTGSWLAGEAPGGAWTSPYQLQSGTLGAGFQIAAGGAGNELAAYSSYDNDQGNDYSTYALPVAVSGSGLAAGASELLYTGMDALTTIAARGARGIAVTVSSIQALHTQTLSSGAFGAEQVIPDTKLSGYPEPAVAMNGKGEAVLVWRDYDPGNADSYAGTLQASFWDGGSWSPQQQISNAGTNPHAWWAKVDLNERGEAVAAWADFEPTGAYTRIYASILETDAGAPSWTAPVAIDQDSPDAGLADQPQNARYVGVSLERDGGAAQVIWMQHEANSAGTSRTWANWIEAP